MLKKISSIPNSNHDQRNYQPNQDKDGIENLQEIIGDWSVLLEKGGDLSIVDVWNMTKIRLDSMASLFIVFLKGQRRQSYELINLKRNERLPEKFKVNNDDKELNVINNFIQ